MRIGYQARHRVPARIGARVVTAAALLVSLGTATTLTLAGAGPAAAAPVGLPAYPGTITLNLGSPNCVTDDVIMNDPSTSLIVTAGSDGSPAVLSQATLPLHYAMSYWDKSSPESDNANWTPGPPPGVAINAATGVISATTGPVPSTSYTVRVTGTDSHSPEGAAGVEQFQLNVNYNGSTVTVSYGGNDSDNANSELTIGLNSNGTQLILNATFLGEPTPNPDAAPIRFTLDPVQPGCHLSGVSPTGAVLTGDGVSDPQIEATTNNGDKVFFTLSGISTDSGGNFFANHDVNPCVSPDVLTLANPGSQSSTQGVAASLSLGASSSTGETITYAATGLPAGLSLNTATGVISGTPTTVGTFPVTVTASDSSNSQSVSFTWNIVTAVSVTTTIAGPGPISSFADYSRSCLDNRGFNWANGNPLQLWACGANGGQDQQALLTTFSGHEVLEMLAPVGKPAGPWCVTDNGAGAQLTITNCTGGANQQISKQGPYYVFGNGTVMDDAGFRTFNGAAVIDYGKNGGRNQRWSLP